MRAFVWHISLFIALQAALLLVQLPHCQLDPNAFLRAITAKMNRVEQFAPPRLMLHGGSSVAFGTVSPEFQRMVGLPTINLGTTRGEGLELWLNELRSLVQKGDVVVISPEYHLLAAGGAPTGMTVAFAVEANPRLLRLITPHQVGQMMDDSVGIVHSLVMRQLQTLGLSRAWVAPPYTLDSFNEYGDVVAHYTMKRKAFPPQHLLAPPPWRLASAVKALNSFADDCRRRGARVFLAYPAVPTSLYLPERERVEFLHRQVMTTLRIPLLNTPAEAVHPDTDFFDTAYHLTREGALRRTRMLAERLKAALHTPD